VPSGSVTNLLNAQIGVSGGDKLAELVREGVEHRVVRVHRRQPVLLDLLGHDSNKFLHADVVVAPVAHDLQAVCQIAVGIWEIWLQLQRRLVRVDRFGDAARILRANYHLCIVGHSQNSDPTNRCAFSSVIHE
jgi:hypothetical protein